MKWTLLIGTLLFAVILCGVASAATVKNIQNNPVNTNSAGLPVDTLEETPDISGNIVVYTKTRQAGMDKQISSEIYYKHLVTRKGGRVSSHYGNFQFNPAISGTRVVWEQHIGSLLHLF